MKNPLTMTDEEYYQYHKALDRKRLFIGLLPFTIWVTLIAVMTIVANCM